VSETEVRANFQRHGLPDDRVRFLPGWFKDTPQDASIDRVALLRLDGDLYESPIQALHPLYPRLSPGRFCIIDDCLVIDACEHAVTDCRAKHGVSVEISEIDGTGVLWRKQSSSPGRSSPSCTRPRPPRFVHAENDTEPLAPLIPDEYER
jgi:O-methyltransferase